MHQQATSGHTIATGSPGILDTAAVAGILDTEHNLSDGQPHLGTQQQATSGHASSTGPPGILDTHPTLPHSISPPGNDTQYQSTSRDGYRMDPSGNTADRAYHAFAVETATSTQGLLNTQQHDALQRWHQDPGPAERVPPAALPQTTAQAASPAASPAALAASRHAALPQAASSGSVAASSSPSEAAFGVETRPVHPLHGDAAPASSSVFGAAADVHSRPAHSVHPADLHDAHFRPVQVNAEPLASEQGPSPSQRFSDREDTGAQTSQPSANDASRHQREAENTRIAAGDSRETGSSSAGTTRHDVGVYSEAQPVDRHGPPGHELLDTAASGVLDTQDGILETGVSAVGLLSTRQHNDMQQW